MFVYANVFFECLSQMLNLLWAFHLLMFVHGNLKLLNSGGLPVAPHGWFASRRSGMGIDEPAYSSLYSK
jgi:hypothetical protein